MISFVYDLRLDHTPREHPGVYRMVDEFLTAHNIDPALVPEKACLRVIPGPDGFWLICPTYRPGWQVCEGGCHNGMIEDRVEVALAAPVPIVPGCRLRAGSETLPRVLPEDPEGMRAAAELHYARRLGAKIRQAIHDQDAAEERLDWFTTTHTVREQVTA